MRTKVYDPICHRILYFDSKANKEFWDDKWEKLASEIFTNPPRNRNVIQQTQKYLPAGSRIMEGGCGLSQMVYSLDNAGYLVHGIDYAPKVVKAVNQHWPHLTVNQGDVRNIPVEGGTFDGYWSFGVIEHFPEGYDDIAQEMWRVLRRGGYLFLSFPTFNRYRQKQAKAGVYPISPMGDCDMKDFYQFALDPADVQSRFEKLGFRLVEHRGTSSLLGLAEDSKVAELAQSTLRSINGRLETIANLALDRVLGMYAGHSALLVLRKD